MCRSHGINKKSQPHMRLSSAHWKTTQGTWKAQLRPHSSHQVKTYIPMQWYAPWDNSLYPPPIQQKCGCLDRTNISVVFPVISDNYQSTELPPSSPFPFPLLPVLADWATISKNFLKSTVTGHVCLESDLPGWGQEDVWDESGCWLLSCLHLGWLSVSFYLSTILVFR